MDTDRSSVRALQNQYACGAFTGHEGRNVMTVGMLRRGIRRNYGVDSSVFHVDFDSDSMILIWISRV